MKVIVEYYSGEVCEYEFHTASNLAEFQNYASNNKHKIKDIIYKNN